MNVSLKEQGLMNGMIALVGVLWKNKQNQKDEESTWELETAIRGKYPHLFLIRFQDGIHLRGGDCNNPRIPVLINCNPEE